MKFRPLERFAPLVLVAVIACISPAKAADRWWDGSNSGSTGDGVSDGGSAIWDGSTTNWDQGNGFLRVAWNNASADTAIFGASGSTVTLGTGITAGKLSFAQSSGTYALIGAQTLTLAGSNAAISNSGSVTIGNSTNATVLAGSSGLTKSGGGALTLQGTAVHSLVGGLTVMGGTMTLNFANLTTPSNMLDSSNALTLGNAAFNVVAKSSGITNQAVNGLVLSGGAAGVGFTSSASSSSTFQLGAINRNYGAVVNFTLPTLGAISSVNNSNTNGILGTWASAGTGTATKYATLSGNTIAALSGTNAADGSALADTTGSANYNLAAGGGTVPALMSANTIRYTGATGTTTPGSYPMTVNGLMNAGTGVWTVGPGVIAVGQDRELVINAANNGINLSGVIQDNDAGPSAVTIIGSGVVTLNSGNIYTGATTINGTSTYGESGKTLIVTSLKNGGTVSEFGTGSSLALNGAVVQTGATSTSDRTITLSGNSGFYVKGVFSQKLTGPISGPGNLSVDGDYNGGAQGGSGNLVLTADNSFTGSVVFQADSRITLNHVNAVKNATLNLSGARSMADLTTYDLNYIIGGLAGSANLDLGGGNVSIGNNDQSTTYAGILSGAGSLTKIGNGNLTLTGANTYAGNTTVNGGTLVTGSNTLPDATKLTINGGKVAPTGTDTIDTLYFGAVQQAAGTWGATGSGADHIDDAHFVGTAGVVRVQPWAADPTVLAFGDVSVGNSIPLDVTITNLGNSPITGTAATSGAPFSVASGSWSVSASSTTTLRVNFSPSAAQAFNGTLTLTGGGLSRTVQLTGNGVAQSTPIPTQFRDYAHVCIAGMPAAASSANLTVAEGASVTQGFVPRRDAFLTGYAARDAAAPTTNKLGQLTLRTGSYTSSPTTLRLEVFRVESNNSRTLLGTEDVQATLFGNTSYKFNLTNPPVMTYDVAHELKITVVTAGNPSYGDPKQVVFFRSSSNYADGAASASGDLWCDMLGSASLPEFTGFSSTAGAGSRFFLDSDPLNANSSSYDTLPGKLLGTAGEAEPIIFTHPVAWGALTFEIDSSGVAAGSVTGNTGTTDTYTLTGQAEGKRMLWIRAGGVVVGWMKLQSYPRRSMRLSYTYVQYPGESNHSLKTMGADIRSYISGVYDKANVGITWTDNGIITHEWDLDGDGQSHEDDYSEVWSPLDSGAIPNQLDVFSNVYMLRYDKDDSTVRGKGGGTSRGLAEIPPPANGATVRCTLNGTSTTLGSTLAHEVGHNLGLGHTNITNNLMDVGRVNDTLWAPQWDIVHSTLAAIPSEPVNPDANDNGLPDAWEDQWFGNHNNGNNPSNGDPDHDDLSNLIEFATNTNPTAFSPSPVTQSLVLNGGSQFLQLSAPRNPAAASYTFVFEFSSDFQSWTPGVVLASDPNFVARDTVPVGTAPRRRFGRLRVISPNP